MKRIAWGTTVAILLLGAGAILFSRTSGNESKRPLTVELLRVDPQHLNFGEIWESDHFTWKFPVVNRSGFKISVTGFDVSCTCLAVRPHQFELQPDESRDIEVDINFSSKKRTSTEAGLSIAPKLLGQNGEPLKHVSWVIHGQAKPLLTLDRLPWLGAMSILEARPAVSEILVTSAISLDDLKVEIEGQKLVAEVQSIPERLGTQFRLRVSPRLPLAFGSLQSPITLIPLKYGVQLPRARLSCSGSVVRDVQASPSSILGGGRKLGEQFPAHVHLQSLTKQPFTIVRVESDEPTTKVQTETAEVTVHLTASKPGQQNQSIRIVVAGADGEYPIPIDVNVLVVP